MLLQTRFKAFNISEIIKAGSLGHGTAVPGKYDIDLVIYSRSKCKAIPTPLGVSVFSFTCFIILGFTGQDVLERHGFHFWLEQLKTFLNRTLGISAEITPHSVQFDYNHLEVDLLVSPCWHNPNQLYNFLKTVPINKRQM